MGHPGAYNYIFGSIRNEQVVYFCRRMRQGSDMFQCNNGGCLMELAQQLAVIMIGRETNRYSSRVAMKLMTNEN